MEKPHLSIVIPAFNESARIEHALAEVTRVIRERSWVAEVLVVDDGSLDATAAIVAQFGDTHPEVHLLRNDRNRGKGFSVRHGVLSSRGDIILFTDADLSAPMEEAERLFSALAEGADVAIGSRWLEASRQTLRQPLYRRFFGRCFNTVTRLIMGLPFADTQCGFKAFRQSAARTLFQLQRIDRWGFDPEILFIALQRGYTVREVPVTWGHDERSRLSYLRDGLRMLEDLVTIRWRELIGAYDKSVPELASPMPAAKG